MSVKNLKNYGPWAVVTGASDGVGRAIASQIAAAGLNLVLIARRASILESMAMDFRFQYGIDVKAIAADLSQPDATGSVLKQIIDLDIGLLVACAGFGSSGPFIESDLAQELSMLDLNCRSVLALAHPLGQRFAAQRRGGIILMSSLLAFQGVPLSANYGATKAYIQSLAEALHIELAPFGVAVLASAPGPIHSGFAARANMQMSFALTPDVVARATLNALGHRTTVRPGWLSLALNGALAMLPRGLRVRAMGQIMRGLALSTASHR